MVMRLSQLKEANDLAEHLSSTDKFIEETQGLDGNNTVVAVHVLAHEMSPVFETTLTLTDIRSAIADKRDRVLAQLKNFGIEPDAPSPPPAPRPGEHGEHLDPWSVKLFQLMRMPNYKGLLPPLVEHRVGNEVFIRFRSEGDLRDNEQGRRFNEWLLRTPGAGHRQLDSHKFTLSRAYLESHLGPCPFISQRTAA